MIFLITKIIVKEPWWTLFVEETRNGRLSSSLFIFLSDFTVYLMNEGAFTTKIMLNYVHVNEVAPEGFLNFDPYKEEKACQI